MEREFNLNDYYTMQNKNVLVSLQEGHTACKNGIVVQESRGKKDIVVGICEASQPGLKIPNRALVWFPHYAGLPMTLNGKNYLVVNHEDIIMIEKVQD
jgi:co-chaperonin GroES (HSP10)